MESAGVSSNPKISAATVSSTAWKRVCYDGRVFAWDPLAAFVMADRGIVTLTPGTVTVIVDPAGPEDGRTKPDTDGAEILVASDPDGAALESALVGWNASIAILVTAE